MELIKLDREYITKITARPLIDRFTGIPLQEYRLFLNKYAYTINNGPLSILNTRKIVSKKLLYQGPIRPPAARIGF